MTTQHSPGPFAILINDRQRLLMIKLIRTALLNRALTLELLDTPSQSVYPDNQLEEANLLQQMLASLPRDDEPVSPGIEMQHLLHGFCL